MEGMLNYFVPEDGDSSDHLNVVPLPRGVDQLRLQHIKKVFPLPGDFHFRFKTAFEGTYVWLDVVNDADVVPDYNGLIISKIARIHPSGGAGAAATAQSATAQAARAPTPVKAPAAPTPDLIETSLPPTPQAKQNEASVPAKAFNDDLVGLLSDPVPATSPPASSPPTPTPSSAPQAPPDPFNLFMGGAPGSGNGNPNNMRPQSAPMNASARGPVSGGPNAFGGQNQGFNPMGSGGPGAMGPRPMGNMNISQMHMGMGQVGGPPGHQQQQQQHSFQGLQWQGMGGQPQQPRGNPMQPNSRQW